MKNSKKKNRIDNDKIFLIDDIIISDDIKTSENSNLPEEFLNENEGSSSAKVAETVISTNDDDLQEVKVRLSKKKKFKNKKLDEITYQSFISEPDFSNVKAETFYQNKNIDNNECKPDDFIDSLKKLTPNEIPAHTVTKKTKKSSTLPILIRTTMLLLCGGVFVYSMLQIVFSYVDSIKSQNIQSNIQEQFYKRSELTAAKASLKSSKTFTLTEMLGADTDGITFTPPELLDKYQQLTKGFRDTVSSGKYPDALGWVKVPGTPVDYLFVLSKDNSDYLKKTPDGFYSNAGSIFADFRTNKDFLSNRHVVLYGHNMTNKGLMFNGITNFFNSNDRWDMFNLSEIQIVTADGLYIYKPFSLYITSDSRYIEYNFTDDNEWTNFLQERLDLSNYSKYTKNLKSYVKPSTKLLTFSTCTNNYLDTSERYVMHCVLTKIVTDN